MVRFNKLFLVVSFGIASAQAATVIPFNAFCYKYEEDCEKAGRILRSRSQNPFYVFDSTCHLEQNSLENRTRVNCAKKQWKLLFQLRSNLNQSSVAQILEKASFPLRSACYRYEYDARSAVELLAKGASLGFSSVNSKYGVNVSYRALNAEEQIKYRNQECHDTRFILEYSLSKK